jgi:hypothetical protein
VAHHPQTHRNHPKKATFFFLSKNRGILIFSHAKKSLETHVYDKSSNITKSFNIMATLPKKKFGGVHFQFLNMKSKIKRGFQLGGKMYSPQYSKTFHI